MQDRVKPSLSELMHRGAVAIRSGRLDEAESHFRQAAQAFGDPHAYSNLAMALAAQGRSAEAVEASLRACELRPDVAELHGNLGNALQLAGDTDGAIEAYRHALALRPGAPATQLNLACALNARGDFEPAVRHLENVLASQPENLAALINWGIALHGKGDPDGAIEAYERAIRLHNSPDAHVNVALVLKDVGRVDEAITHVRRSLEIRPDPKAADLLLLLIQYHPDYDRRQIIEEHRLWFARYVEGSVRPRTHEMADRLPVWKLKIGYVSPDFRRHPVGYNVLPLIENHDRSRFEIFCYSNVTRPDALTDRFRAACDHWRNIRPLSDDQAADVIAADRIDILVDLSLHTGENRLGVFARKPAPVQVTFAGYPGTTGLPAIDCRLTDPYLDPPEQADGGFCEKALRLKHSFWCYQPLGTEPDVNDLPALANGYVTFGCLNNFCKINDKVLDVWASVLLRVCDSRLILLTGEGSHRRRTLDHFGESGIDPSRIEFVAPGIRDAYLGTYHRLDVALDTFPYNGHTTSLDAMWMGVPVVTLVGDLPVGRGGWSQLNNLGLKHLAAFDPDSYAQIAAELARDPGALAGLRATLRGRMLASALTDSRRFAGSVESIFHGIAKNAPGGSAS